MQHGIRARRELYRPLPLLTSQSKSHSLANFHKFGKYFQWIRVSKSHSWTISSTWFVRWKELHFTFRTMTGVTLLGTLKISITSIVPTVIELKLNKWSILMASHIISCIAWLVVNTDFMIWPIKKWWRPSVAGLQRNGFPTHVRTSSPEFRLFSNISILGYFAAAGGEVVVVIDFSQKKIILAFAPL